MPEVSEVALTVEILSKHLKGKILISFDFVEGRFLRSPPKNFKKFNKALPLRVKKIDSKGKFIWFDLADENDQHWYIFNTLGLTGMWSLSEAKYTKAILSFTKNKIAYFSDLRNFGTFIFTDNQDVLEKKLDTLGPDFLKQDFDISDIQTYDVPIIKLLMDQTKLGSGLGNYLTAEILYRAKLSPKRLGSSLSNSDVTRLTRWIKYTVKLSYVDNHIGYMKNLEKEADKIRRKNYHPDIKLKKKEFEFLVYRQKTDPFGNKVKADNIIKGRTTYWVPKVQK